MTTPTLTPVRHEEIAICNATILAAVTSDDRCYFSPRHVCGALGITWQGQLEKIKADPVLAKGVTNIVTPSAGGPQTTLMLPIEFLSGWLFTIKKVRPEVQDKLNVFRAEGFVALDAWFRKGLRHSPTVADMLSNPDFAIELLTKFKEEQEARRRAEVNARDLGEHNRMLAAQVRATETVLDELDDVITEHLRYVTVDKWRALNQMYLRQGEKVRLGKRASELCRQHGHPIGKEPRVIHTAFGTKDRELNVYPLHILNQAGREMGLKVIMEEV
ncbi:hypothetical protein FVW20_13650 [Desulfovibrio oxamicus]|uniref:Antirepressor protein ant N-terminal domain-containing protein n=1 Tax=Nitratidesulfovibrio oxamicus TaxID=32016 RepID=A0ABS0J8G3_9BACT|nr:phage antirepressor N-terminal domain-containing protein [Nitratidesulfovibrio oxamicus]MBG3878023.1 hypothetical protein [Nitratidesulfovibrio oxamicus]